MVNEHINFSAVHNIFANFILFDARIFFFKNCFI